MDEWGVTSEVFSSRCPGATAGRCRVGCGPWPKS